MGEPIIRLRGLTKLFSPEAPLLAAAMREGRDTREILSRHRQALALYNVDLDVQRGSIQVVMGLSGSGKSTLVRHINRLIEPTSGEVLVDGTDVLGLSENDLRAFRRRRLSMVFQRFALLPHHTVEENVSYGVRSAGASAVAQAKVAREWIARVGLEGTERLYPSQLSGGMQQRVGLARALATDADILLMDEAFSALDPLIRREMQDLLLDLQRDLGRTIVFVTHDLDEALRIGDRIAILRDGEIVQEGSRQDIVLNPVDDYVAAFVGQVDRSRVVEVGSLLRDGQEPWEPNTPRPLSVPYNARVRDVARDLAASNASVAEVINEKGDAVGRVTLFDLVKAMTKRYRKARYTADERTATSDAAE